jgi:hypothetical protein
MNARKSTTSTPTAATITPVTAVVPVPVASAPPPVPPKLSYAQQIRTLKEKMTNKERGNYLDARDMGEDFCSAGY